MISGSLASQILTYIIDACPDDQKVTIITPEAKLVTIPQANIEARKAGKSSMPEDLVKYLTKPELRDLVEFLANQR